MENFQFSCANCKVGNCAKLDKGFPKGCLTVECSQAMSEHVMQLYKQDEENIKIALAGAEVESEYYGRATRVEEILIFIKKMGYQRIGVATCIGLLDECNTFSKIARDKGIEVFGVACKVGAVDKTEIGLREKQKLNPNNHESMCNPILQAEYLNEQKTDFNIIIGLCVGHDTIFIKHSKAPVTYLIVKDRVLGHNPAAALYACHSYYKRLLDSELPQADRKE